MTTQKAFNIIWLTILCAKYVNSAEFFAGSVTGDYDTSIQTCLDEGGVLATFTSQKEFDELRGVCTFSHCWIGLNRRVNAQSQSTWTYVDGTNVANTYGFGSNGLPLIGQYPWGPDQPNSDRNEPCVAFHQPTQRLHDYLCSGNFLPLCKRIETNPQKELCLFNVYILM